MKKKESEFDKLARIFKEEIDDVKTDLVQKIDDAKIELKEEIGGKIDKLELNIDKGFYNLSQRLDVTIQPQLDEHARRIKKLETKVLS